MLVSRRRMFAFFILCAFPLAVRVSNIGYTLVKESAVMERVEICEANTPPTLTAKNP